MELSEKLQQLRRQKGITQQELAQSLFVSRTAISKWESGRGYPNIESLKAIADFFSVTLDALLSSREILTIAEQESRQRKKHSMALCFGLVDLCMVMLLFLPFFAQRADARIEAVALFFLAAKPYLRVAYFCAVIACVLMGAVRLAPKKRAFAFEKVETAISLSLGVAAVLLFTVSAQPYAAVFAFVLLSLKALFLLRLR